MRVKVASEVTGLGDVTIVRAEQAPELSGRNSLADALVATHDNRDLALPTRVLHGVGHPIEQILDVLLVPGADVLAEVRQVEARNPPRRACS